MEHLNFLQQVIIAAFHAGPPTLAVGVSYLALRSHQNKHTESIKVELNGGLEARIKKAVKAAIRGDKGERA